MGIVKAICVGVIVTVIANCICESISNNTKSEVVNGLKTCGAKVKNFLKTTKGKLCSKVQSQQ